MKMDVQHWLEHLKHKLSLNCMIKERTRENGNRIKKKKRKSLPLKNWCAKRCFVFKMRIANESQRMKNRLKVLEHAKISDWLVKLGIYLRMSHMTVGNHSYASDFKNIFFVYSSDDAAVFSWKQPYEVWCFSSLSLKNKLLNGYFSIQYGFSDWKVSYNYSHCLVV